MKTPFAALALCLCAPVLAQFKTVGYYPSWTSSTPPVDFTQVTHVNYAFAVPFADGTLTSINEGRVKLLVDPAHAAGVKVCIALGGWNNGNSTGFQGMAADPAIRAVFIKKVMDLIEYHKFDGADVDWEYPKDAGQSANYAVLMKELGEALHAKGLLLSTAVAPDAGVGKWIPAEVFGYIDMLNIMAYDAGTANHSPYALADSALNYWVGRGCPKEKAILGVPFYGRAFSTGKLSSYSELVKMDPLAPTKDIVGEIRYNGIPTIQQKTDLAYHKGGGVMIWDLSLDTFDSTSLLNAIYEKVKTFPAGIGRGSVAARPLFQILSPDVIRFQAPRQGAYVLRIHSASGRIVREVSAAGAGTVEFRWNGSSLASGVYAASVLGDGFVRSRPLILPRR